MSTRSMTTENIVHLSPVTSGEKIKYSTIEQAIEDIKNGKAVIVADDEGRENEGDLICAADKITPEMINFMLMHARGMICVAMTPERATELNLNQMVDENTDPHRTAFTVSVDASAAFGVTTGVSAQDRATTVQRLAATDATPQDFRRPGHMFPVQAKTGGVFRRIGHTEAAIDLTRLAGLSPIGVICEVLNDDGSMARRDDLAAFAKKHNVSYITIAQLIQYRLEHERSVTRRVAKEIETKFGTFTAVGYKDALDGSEHLAFVKGSVEKLTETVPYIRIQHEDVLGEVLGTSEEMPNEMAQAMQMIQGQETGVLVYLRQSLLESVKSYRKIEANAHQAYEANQEDLRDYGVGAQIMADLGVGRFKMISQSEKKIVALRGYGLEVAETVPLSAGKFDHAFPPKVQLPSASTTIPTQEVAPVVTAQAETVVETPVTVVVMETPVAVAPVHVVTPIVQPEIAQEVVEEKVAAVEITAKEPAPIITDIVPEQVVTPVEVIVTSAAPLLEPVVTPVVTPQAVVSEVAPVSFSQLAQNENNKTPVQEAPKAELTAESAKTIPVVTPETTPELKAEPRFATMRMGGQIMSGQALFEG